MDRKETQEPTADEVSKMQADIQNALAEIEQVRQRIERNQNEIEKSRARTRAMLARLLAE